MAGLRDVLDAGRADLARLDRSTMGRFLKRYRAARKELDTKLAGLKAENEWSRANLLYARELVADGIAAMSARLGETLARASGRSLRMGTKALASRWETMSRIFGGLPPAPINIPVLKVVDQLENLLLMRFEASRLSYGEQVISRIGSALERGLLLRESPSATIKRVMRPTGILDEEQWRAARIVRTELANAYEMANHTAGRVAILTGDLPPDTRKRLVSHFDARTGRDSYSPRQHGQVRKWDEEFEDPVTGRRYMHPPNRPNDRAVSLPWHEGWDESKLLADRTPPPAA